MATTFYATNNFTGDGTTVNWNINFADGYIDTTNVRARYLDNTGSYVDIAISSVAGNVVTISPAVANGQEFQIYRDTEKRFPLVDFSDGAILNETNLDTLATQAVMVSAEAFDQSNNGVRIAGDALTIAQGIDAKAQEALDNSEAAVATADGIAGTANTALSNSQTALNTANDAKNTADGIAATANQALTNSNTAITTANGAVTTANSAASTANGIDAKATQALNNSNTAVNDASTALNTANAIDGKAQLALDNTAALDATTMKKAANLSDIADKAAAWLNVRPIGSTPLAGDPVGDYDAATKRWVENLISTGTVGPTMNGVMNFGVGDFHIRDSRSYIQPYEVVSDGQLLNRADWPELWAYAQMLSPITDAAWLADPLKRGAYSTGNGTTTFRVPDRNGVQSGSVRALFGRGDGGNSAINGSIMNSFVPNITASLSFHGSGPAATPSSGTTLAGVNGALRTTGDAIPRYVNGTTLLSGAANSFGGADFDASRSSAAYGRGGLSTDEVLPRNFTGVWVIRASGGFVAANTQWSVINSDAALPPAATPVDGGEIKSQYLVGTVNEAQLSWRIRALVGGNYYGRLSVYNGTAGRTAVYDFNDNGAVTLPANGSILSGTQKIDFAGNDLYATTGKLRIINPVTGGQTMGIAVLSAGTRGRDQAWFEHWGNSFGGGGDTTRATVVELKIGSGYAWYSQLTTAGAYETRFAAAIYASAFTQTSDERIKEDIVRIPDPLTKMRNIRGVSWKFKTSGQAVGYGFIAQDVETDFPDAVNTYGSETLVDGTVVTDVKSVNTSGVAAALHHEAILALMDKVAALEARIDELTSQ